MKFHGLENMQLLFSKVNRLTQLRDSQRKFNAFIFGLLNMKQLDVWVLHLHQIYNQLSIFYLPSGFLPLAATLQPELRDELLLSLQPLSALTFHTDLLFEHHHLSLQDLPTPQRVHSPAHVAEHWAVPSLQTILDLGGWITHNLTWNTENKAQSPIKGKSMDSPGDKCFRDGSQPDLQTSPGDMSDHSVHVSSETTESIAACDTKTSSDQIPSREVTSTWWNHLSQASRIYIPTSKESVTFSTLKKLTSWGSTDRELSQKASASKATDCPQQRLRDTITNTGAAQNTAYENEQPPVDTEEDNPGVDNAALSSAASDGTSYGPGVDNAALSSAASDGTSYGDGPEQIETPITKAQPPNNHEKATWLGQLFGAGSTHGPEMEARNSKSRRPSSWLPPNVSVWNLIRKQETAMRPEILEHKEVESRQRQQIRPQRSLRAICDHSASGEAQLSFKKGDVLQLLGTVDEDWIQCRRGNDAGLVPVGYTSLIL
ncbi:hypothetical protein GDO81_026268 [Engystomops pustulosus]|uniref:RUN and SH3 domain containing 1 n=4 Tax=Engystomops pustulosus TaxID=76066 RepID=A0AAV6Z0P6_ENGPU|nr:hypothetical protein GDO81_026268 [Engystomops pustulosus]KAG8542692.1 hypothetical protein GDO81_026268 [Engystomops pustulosus]